MRVSVGTFPLVSRLLVRPSVSYNSEIINYTIIFFFFNHFLLNDISNVSVRLTL